MRVRVRQCENVCAYVCVCVCVRVCACVCSNGVQQRVHRVWESDGSILVQLSLTEPVKVKSDEYACMESCGDRVLQSKPGVQALSVGGDGKKPSGGL